MLLLALSASLVPVGATRRWGAWAIARAPNFDASPDPMSPPADVFAVIRADVGPPAATLEAWVLEPPEPRGTTLVLHGIDDQKSSMLEVGRSLSALGHRAVLVDLRGHGASTGRWLTYGVRESEDLRQLLDQLDALGLITGEVGVYGPSYGGAVALHAAARDPRITRVVSVSTFASLRAVVPPYAERAIPVVGGLLPELLLDAVVEDAGALGGFSPAAADTAAATAQTRARVLLIHGDADENVPYEHALRLRAACTPRACELVTIPGAGHAQALSSQVTLSRALDFLTHGLARRPSGPRSQWTEARRF